MLGRLIPRDEQFFDLFNQLAEHLKTAAALVDRLFAEPQNTTELVRQIKDIEHQADVLTLSINVRIDKSFITPIDREDIHLLASRLDDVIDRLDGTARRAAVKHSWKFFMTWKRSMVTATFSSNASRAAST